MTCHHFCHTILVPQSNSVRITQGCTKLFDSKLPIIEDEQFPILLTWLLLLLFMWGLDYKEASGLSNWCFWTVMLKETLEKPMDCKEIKPVNPKGNQPWIFIRRTDAEAKEPILWPSDAKSQLIRKDPNAGKDWRKEEKGKTEDEMDGWHHWLNLHEFEQTLGDAEGQGSLICCSPWGHKEWHDWATGQKQQSILRLISINSSRGEEWVVSYLQTLYELGTLKELDTTEVT